MESDSGGWDAWGKHVLRELKRMNGNYEKLERRFSNMHLEMTASIAALKVKAGIWGLIGGAVPVVIGGMVWLLKTKGE